MSKNILFRMSEEFEHREYEFKSQIPLAILNKYEQLMKKDDDQNSDAAYEGIVYLLCALSIKPKLDRKILLEDLSGQEVMLLYNRLLEETNQIPKLSDDDYKIMRDMTVEQKQDFIRQLMEARFNDLKKKQMRV